MARGSRNTEWIALKELRKGQAEAFLVKKTEFGGLKAAIVTCARIFQPSL